MLDGSYFDVISPFEKSLIEFKSRAKERSVVDSENRINLFFNPLWIESSVVQNDVNEKENPVFLGFAENAPELIVFLLFVGIENIFGEFQLIEEAVVWFWGPSLLDWSEVERIVPQADLLFQELPPSICISHTASK